MYGFFYSIIRGTIERLCYIKQILADYFSNGYLRPLKEGKYELTYYHAGEKFRIRFSRRRGVRNITNVFDVKNMDVTREFFEYMGPGLNFYGIPTTPRLLGWEYGLFVHYRSGVIKLYQPDEYISL